MTNEIEQNLKVLENVVIKGDLQNLNPAERLSYYSRLCESLGLNPMSKPFAYIQLNGKLVLYALKDCTDQLRSIKGISIEIVSREFNNDLGLFLVTANGTNKEGRKDSSLGVVSTKGLVGDSLSNALMKAETKAKRRVTLSLSGLGMLDESEADSIPSAKIVDESILENEETERLNLIHDIEAEMPKREFNLEEFYKFLGSEDLQNVSLTKLRLSAKALSSKPIKTGQLGQEWSK